MRRMQLLSCLQGIIARRKESSGEWLKQEVAKAAEDYGYGLTCGISEPANLQKTRCTASYPEPAVQA